MSDTTTPTAVAPPEASLTPEEVIARAERLRPRTAGTGPFTVEMDPRLDQMAIQAGVRAWNAADVLVRTGGSSPMHNNARMQRYLRDLTMYRTHMAASAWEEMATTAARFHLQPAGPARDA
jgi:hypothetical protein